MSDEAPIDRVLPKLGSVRPSGAKPNQWTALCPAHADAKHSLAVGVGGDGRVITHCYAGCSFDAVAAALGLEKRDFFPNRTAPRFTPDKGVTVAALAWRKRLPEEYLRSLGLADKLSGSKYEVLIPYRGADGAELFVRERTALRAKDGSKQPAGVRLQCYGLWLLAEFRARPEKRLVVVEGESDCWALWHHGYAAVGVPGSNAVGSALTSDVLAGFADVLVWQETDAAGGKFVGAVATAVAAAGLTCRVIRSEAKDAADLHAGDPAGFRAALDALVAAAPPVAPDGAPEPAGSGAKLYHLSDNANARRLARRHGADLRYCAAWDKWLIWDGSRWRRDETGEITRRAVDTAEAIFEEIRGVSGEDNQKKWLAWWQASQREAALRAMTRLAESVPPVPVSVDDLDADPWLFNCANGTIDLRTGELRPPRRADLLTQASPVAFEPAARCPLWESFLDTVFAGNAGLIGYIRRLFGYGLTGDVREHTLPIFWGAGANGKSTALETAALVFGPDYWCSAPDGMLMVRRNEGHPTELARLYRKRFVAATETEEGARLNGGLVKRLTGGDTITARFMRQDFFEFRPTHKMLIATNDRPRVVGGGHGMWRRLALVPFAVKFWRAELGEVGHDRLRADPTLPVKLRAELPGILAWMVRGCLEWQAGGLNPPDEVKVATGDYKEQQNTIGAFLRERCDQVTNEAGAETTVKDLYAAYCRWSEESGEQPFGKIRFNEAVQRENVVRGRNNRTNIDVWKGLRLRAGAAHPVSIRDLDDD